MTDLFWMIAAWRFTHIILSRSGVCLAMAPELSPPVVGWSQCIYQSECRPLPQPSRRTGRAFNLAGRCVHAAVAARSAAHADFFLHRSQTGLMIASGPFHIIHWYFPSFLLRLPFGQEIDSERFCVGIALGSFLIGQMPPHRPGYQRFFFCQFPALSSQSPAE